MTDADDEDILTSTNAQAIVEDQGSALESITVIKCDPNFSSKHGNKYEELKFIERFSGSDGRQVEVYQKVDRANDRYIEIVKDAVTGEIIKEADELLSEHRGHGTAKK